MCLGLPGVVTEVLADGRTALVEIAGVVREIDVAMLAAPLQPGEHVLVHSGVALERMSEEQARQASAIFGADGARTGSPPRAP